MNELLLMFIRVTLSAILSGIIGLERETRNQPAGLRTHILVGIGACVLMLLSLYGFKEYANEYTSQDLTRIPAYVISGLGFLCAGAIIVHKTDVKGLTTAASLWIVAAIGLVVGVGMYELAIMTTIIVLFSLTVLQKINKKIDKENKNG